ncbi:hypothetical protein EXU48_14370 [Occultella glacieicola]|uniref:Peptidase M10 metallopeptidase domain-containing protein n=1 Tax=Occultella glacieicola TaxID=2518684 RepID=A0ABY2E3K9_9MICO|nr:hypothetical protein [Occultella glacieicola]TDE92705.1 hypothetical protein EXU48_14370 [Occultella glacieicola]
MSDDDQGSGCCGDDGPLYYDEQGDLLDLPVIGPLLSGLPFWPRPAPVDPRIPVEPRIPIDPRIPVEPHIPIQVRRPCSLPVLNGSWLIEFTASRPIPVIAAQQIRGPMRIEVRDTSLRVSGDVYVRRTPILGTLESMRTAFQDEAESYSPGPPDAGGQDQDLNPDLVLRGVNGAPLFPSYPQLPTNQYSWYFRSTGVTYSGGTLTFGLRRHVWNRTSQDFVSTDSGTMTLTCTRSILARAEVATMSGTATIGGVAYHVNARKTSNSYRGCAVEVDVMTGRDWPASALNHGVSRTFQNVYASAGWDVRVRVDQLDIPSDASLSMAELQTLLTSHRGPGAADPWRLWLLIGSAQGGLLGVMFDDDSVPREGAVGFADATLSNSSVIEAGARGQAINDVPAALLRTMVHEAGHALNLFHPKHDVHDPPIGTEIMNQTGDVISFASVSNPYPGNATFAFAVHDRDSLIHAPDPQVRPGWQNFGWGHGSLSSGLPVPTDASGLGGGDDAEGLRLELTLPGEIYVGEYVTAELTLTNTGDEPREVTARLNLAEGYLRLQHVLPDGSLDQVRDVVVACGTRPTAVLAPGESLSARMQLFFTSEGITFSQPGTHVVRAEFDVDLFSTARSPRATVYVRTAATETEVTIAAQTLDSAVGRAFALGDFGTDTAVRDRLVAVAEAHHDADTGAAAALVLANSFARAHVDHRSDARAADDGGRAAARKAAPEEAKHFLDLAMQGRSAEEMVRLAATVASPVESDAPVVTDALGRAKRARKGKADLAAAEAIVADFVAASPA